MSNDVRELLDDPLTPIVYDSFTFQTDQSNMSWQHMKRSSNVVFQRYAIYISTSERHLWMELSHAGSILRA